MGKPYTVVDAYNEYADLLIKNGMDNIDTIIAYCYYQSMDWAEIARYNTVEDEPASEYAQSAFIKSRVYAHVAEWLTDYGRCERELEFFHKTEHCCPYDNEKCSKTGCYINGGECERRTKRDGN